MKFNSKTAQAITSEDLMPETVLRRTTHRAIDAHQDDSEIMAIDGILQCFQNSKKWFSGVVITNGNGSPRDGPYKDYTDDEMRAVRVKEQQKSC